MKKKILFIIFVLLVCAGLGFYFYQKLVSKEKNIDASNQLVGNSNVINIGDVAIQGEGDMKGVKIERIDVVNDKSAVNIPVPDLDREIKIVGNMSEDAVRIATDKIKDLSAQLKKDSDNLENWLLLGIYRKMLNDYEGARLAWEYAGAIRPQSGIPFNNLGDLYAYYLKDTLKAEKYFLQAIRSEPNNMYFYFKIVDFYKDFKDTAKARAILEKGIAANPTTSSDLKNLLENVQPATSDLPR